MVSGEQTLPGSQSIAVLQPARQIVERSLMPRQRFSAPQLVADVPSQPRRPHIPPLRQTPPEGQSDELSHGVPTIAVAVTEEGSQRPVAALHTSGFSALTIVTS